MRRQRDMTQAQFAEAMKRNGFSMQANGDILTLIHDDQLGYSFGSFGSSWWRKAPRRQRLAWVLQKRDEEAKRRAGVAHEKEQRRRALAATLGLDPDTGALLHDPLGLLGKIIVGRGGQFFIDPPPPIPWLPRVIVKGDPINAELGVPDAKR